MFVPPPYLHLRECGVCVLTQMHGELLAINNGVNFVCEQLKDGMLLLMSKYFHRDIALIWIELYYQSY